MALDSQQIWALWCSLHCANSVSACAISRLIKMAPDSQLIRAQRIYHTNLR